MKNRREIRYIGEDLFIEIIRNDENTIVNIIDNGERINIENFKNNEFIKLNVVNNDDYIIVFTIGYSKNERPFNIEKIYDINEREILDIPSSEIKNIYENMLIYEKAIDLKTIILLINGIFDNSKVIELYKYLTANNSNITIDMVSTYIIKKYPELKKYVGFDNEEILLEYFKTTNDFDTNYLYLKVMPQNMDDIIENNNGYCKKLYY